MAAEAPLRTKLIAGFALTCVSTSVGLLYKSSQASSGGFHFSTVSAIAMAEVAKLLMSISFHIGDSSHSMEGSCRLVSAWKSAASQLSAGACLQIMFLAFLYASNNQLTFFIATLVDPGTIFLFKAASTLIVAVIQCTFVGKKFSKDQWKAIFLQGVGMLIVQYNPCKGMPRYRPFAYVMMVASAIVTSTCAVRNEYLVKNYKIGLNVQNAVLYCGGSFLNVSAFLFL